jgi:hypothetical protein
MLILLIKLRRKNQLVAITSDDRRESTAQDLKEKKERGKKGNWKKSGIRNLSGRNNLVIAHIRVAIDANKKERILCPRKKIISMGTTTIILQMMSMIMLKVSILMASINRSITVPLITRVVAINMGVSVVLLNLILGTLNTGISMIIPLMMSIGILGMGMNMIPLLITSASTLVTSASTVVS